MVKVAQTPSAQRHYKCNQCGGNSKCGHLGGDKTSRWRCFKCDYDVCFKCQPEMCSPAPQEPPKDAAEEAHQRYQVDSSRLDRCNTVEAKRMLQGNLEELDGMSATLGGKEMSATAVAPAQFAAMIPRQTAAKPNLQIMPKADSENAFLQRCQIARLNQQLEAHGMRASPSPTLLESKTITTGKATMLSGQTVPHLPKGLTPDADLTRGFEGRLKRRPTMEVKRILQTQLEAFQHDPCLFEEQQVELPPMRMAGASFHGLSEHGAADNDIVGIPELSHPSRKDGGVTCTCFS